MCMDDSTQKQNQNQAQAQNVISEPANPISAPQKEAEALPVNSYVTASEIAPVIEQEVAEAGVREVVQAPQLTEEHFKTGIKHAAETTPVQTQPTGTINLPISQFEAQGMVKGSTEDGQTWLASFVLRFIKKMRLNGNNI